MADSDSDDAGMTVNRLGTSHVRGGMASLVDALVDALVYRDRWRIARLATGELLDDLLGGACDDTFGGPGDQVGLAGAPVVMVDDGMAVVIAEATGPHRIEPVPVCALLVQSVTPGRGWLVAALTHDRLVDIAFQRRVQREAFSEDADADIIDRHSPLDEQAAAVEWTDDAAVVWRTPDRVVTVADARADAEELPRVLWPRAAADKHTIGALYLRGTHPELVGEFTPGHRPVSE